MITFFDARCFWGIVFTRNTRLSTLVTIMSLCLMLFLAGCGTTASVKTDSFKPETVKSDTVKIIQAGDVADIRYLCKLKNGEAVASTDTLAENQPKSALFVPTRESGPVSVMASNLHTPEQRGQDLLLEDEIISRLAAVVVGMNVGETRHVELTADDLAWRAEENYVAQLSRVRKRPRELKIPLEEYEKRIGKSAEVGQPVIIDPKFPGRVEAVTDKEVVVRFSAVPGTIEQTPFGPGSVLETENEIQIKIDAKVGTLIRTGQLVGRITSVNDALITVDYRNPFGREPLTCDVTVDKIEDSKRETEAKQAEDQKGDSSQINADTEKDKAK